jgi:hypothetical protein
MYELASIPVGNERILCGNRTNTAAGLLKSLAGMPSGRPADNTVRPTEVRMSIIINGAGIAGPTLAYWLREAAHDVLLVEEAPQLRRGGYVIDFGLVGYDIAEKMGLIPRLRELGYRVRETRLVDRQGRTSASLLTENLFQKPGFATENLEKQGDSGTSRTDS